MDNLQSFKELKPALETGETQLIAARPVGLELCIWKQGDDGYQAWIQNPNHPAVEFFWETNVPFPDAELVLELLSIDPDEKIWTGEPMDKYPSKEEARALFQAFGEVQAGAVMEDVVKKYVKKYTK